jgi:hypothetical protein
MQKNNFLWSFPLSLVAERKLCNSINNFHKNHLFIFSLNIFSKIQNKIKSFFFFQIQNYT